MRLGRNLSLCLWVVAFLASVSAARCQTQIIFRFIDSSSGKPIAGITVGVDAWDQNEGRQKPESPDIVRTDKNRQLLKTDKDGTAVFQLYENPALRTLNVSSFDLRGCSSTRFSIEEVLKSGVVAGYHAGEPKWCVQLKAQAAAAPNEVIIFDKKLTLWNRMSREIP